MQKARCHPEGLQPLVSIRFQVLFHPCSGCFSPFPHGTGSLSVSQEYLALADGAAGFPQGVSDPAVLRILIETFWDLNTGLSPSLAYLFKYFFFLKCFIFQSYNPNATVVTLVWANPRSLATTCGITELFSFPPGT
jgi:hypothetical protein